MLDEEFLHSLPEDPEMAFGMILTRLKSELNDQNMEDMLSQNSRSVFETKLDILNVLAAFLNVNKVPSIEIDIEHFEAVSGGEFQTLYNSKIREIERGIAESSFRRSTLNKSGTAAIYVLTPDLKSKIHLHINSIREMISISALTEAKRAVLSKKLNAFANEVDRNRTNLEALASAMIWARKEVIEGAQGLEPIIEKLDKMFQSFAKATEFIRLPSTIEVKQIPPPRKQIEGPKENFEV